MNKPSAEENKEVRTDKQTVSQCLAAAREALGLSQKEIANALNLTETFIRYLDEGQFEKLPKPAFVKGYIRSYAKIVNLQGDDMIALYEVVNEEPDPPREFSIENVNSSSGLEWQTNIIGLFLIVLVIAAVWIFSTGEEAKPILQAIEADPEEYVNSFQTGIDEDATAESDADQSVPALTVSVEDQDPTQVETIVDTSIQELPDELADLDQSGTKTVVDQSIQELPDTVEDQELTAELELVPTSDVSIERTESDDFKYINVDAGGFDKLEFTFTDECWVEIQDGAGPEKVYFDLQRDGDILTFYGVSPFKILLGYPSAVTLKFNQEEVDLMEYEARDGTARINIGE